MGESFRMGKSAPPSKDSDSFRKSSAMLKDTRDQFIVGFSKKGGTFEYDPSLKNYMNDKMKVVRVTRYLDPMKAKGYGLGHEYLVVDLRTPEDDQLVIRAEKEFISWNHENYPPGGLTTVTRIADPPKFARENKDRVKNVVVLEGGVKILMKDLIDILGACNRCYSLWKHNCWRYAYETFRNLLEKFAGLADTSDDWKKKIREELEKMPRPSLPAEIFEESGLVLLGLSVAGALIYGGAVGGIAAFKYLQGLIMAGTFFFLTVKGLYGSSLLKSSVAAAKCSVVEESCLKALIYASCGIGTGGFLFVEFELMLEKHSFSANA